MQATVSVIGTSPAPGRALAHQIREGAITAVNGELLAVTKVSKDWPHVTLSGNIIPAGNARVTIGVVTLDMDAEVTVLPEGTGGDALRRAREIAQAEYDVHVAEAFYASVDDGTTTAGWFDGEAGNQDHARELAGRELDDARARLTALRGAAVTA